MSGYIYIRTNELCRIKNIVKLGITSISPKDREYGYTTYEHKRGHYLQIYKIELKHLKYADMMLKKKFKPHNQYIDCGTEYYDPIIVYKIEPYLKYIGLKIYKYTQEDMEKIKKRAVAAASDTEIKFTKIIQLLKENKMFLQKLRNYLKNKDNCVKNSWVVRDYQTEAINHGYQLLLQDKKFYLELPTGGGKSYIVYNILKLLIIEIDLILIISPRKIVNTQNVSEKYINLLNKPCNIYNYSNGNTKKFNDFLHLVNMSSIKTTDKKTVNILIVCTSSVDLIINKFYEKIKDLKICIWFDEAHYGIESWICESKVNNNKVDKVSSHNFYLTDMKNIKYRIFTSASPDASIIVVNKEIFGELYNPITVNDLIKLNYLCNIIPYVYMEDKKNINKIKFMLNEFTDKNRNFGFSFHNSQLSAFELFYFHYREYKDSKTNIKPFLLIGLFSYKENNKIDLDYDYTNIKEFEKNSKNIGYVVAKYSMGYDFNLLDFITFNDPKLSFKDIIQCIGRGIRSDCLGINGINLNKYLIILLPVYVDESSTITNKYHIIKKVLQYLLHDIKLNIGDFWFVDSIDSTNSTNSTNLTTNSTNLKTNSTNLTNLIKYNYYKFDEKYKNLGDITVLSTVLNLLKEKKQHDVKLHNFTNSIIQSAKIVYLGIEHIQSRLKYKSIRDNIYILINDRDKIIKDTTINIKPINKTDRGFTYLSELDISIQGVDSNTCIYEIITQCEKNNIAIQMNIKLTNNNIVNIEI